MTIDKQGVEVRRMKKKPYYECDIGPRGQGVLRQTLLSFSRTPSRPARTGEDHDRAGVSNFDFSSTTLGQHGKVSVQAAGTELE